MAEENFFAILKFESFDRIHLFTKEKRFMNINLRTLIANHSYFNKWLIIVAKQKSLQEIGTFMRELYTATDIREYIITYPSVSVRYTFNISQIFYVSLKFVDFLKIEDFSENLVEEEEGENQLKKNKRKNSRKGNKIECLLEISEREEVYASTRFEGNLYKCVKFVYDFLERRIDKCILYNLIYIDSDSDQLKTAFQNKLLMFVCENTANFSEKIYSVKFLPSPYFLKEVNYIWKTVGNDAVAIGGLRIEKIFFSRGMEFLPMMGFILN
ncbi:hypothetical protein TUBRATIS_26420 [Tubulinosema ratisbonensis]|uniref:Uncharacterized protein n=1 Tax=Tubulinosema ratisbonensis TaxID=291195 RepID=A0A437AIC3_9MICR|nr:hypothetical protein TUBRATIS_26420 [Tubulinosema ratisbonensis]